MWTISISVALHFMGATLMERTKNTSDKTPMHNLDLISLFKREFMILPALAAPPWDLTRHHFLYTPALASLARPLYPEVRSQ